MSDHPTPPSPRALILQRLREKVNRGLPIIGAGAGTGLSASDDQTDRETAAMMKQTQQPL